MNFEKALDVFLKILASYSLLLIIYGTILNSFLFYVCLRSRKLRSTSTFKLLASVSISDTLSLFMWMQEHFVSTFFNIYFPHRSLFYCQTISIWVQYSTLQFSSWMYMSISLDRYLSLIVRKWRQLFSRRPWPFVYSVVLAFCICAINLNENWTAGLIEAVNGTEVIFCFVTKINQFDWIKLMSEVIIKNSCNF